MQQFLFALFVLSLPSWAQLQPKFEVLRATYGAGSTQADVTERVRSLVSNGGLTLQVNAETLGTDPVPNTAKTLTVDYRQGIFRRTARGSDFDTLRIGNAPAAPAESLRITRAQYGDGKRMRDVTDLLNTKIANARIEFLVNNANLGGDPAPAVKKSLVVAYVLNGAEATATIAEGETLRLSAAGVAPGAPATNLKIVKALYTGGRAGTADVTAAIERMIAADTLEVAVNGATIGTDPAPGVQKTLSVEYDYNGQRQLVTARDGEVLRINKTAPAGTLRILRASYSAGRRATADVTRAVANRVSADSLELPVNGDSLGTDPAPGTVKSLTVEYEYNGQRQVAIAKDAEILVLPPITTFNVISATYGVPGRTLDVTNIVAARRLGLRVDVPVNGETFGTDPAPGVVKTLTVEYEVNGRRRVATAQDSETLRAPSSASAVSPVTILPGAVSVSGKGPVVAATTSTNSGPCLYRQANYSGEAVCLSAAQPLPAVANWQSGFRSVRMNGAAAVDLFEQANFGGRSQTVTADIADLMQIPGTWWRYEIAAPVQSIRAR